MTSARARTLQHMKRLASLAAAGAALSGASCGSSGSSGYGVVDPLPPPPRCGNVTGAIAATAVLRDGLIELTLAKPVRADISYVVEEPYVTGATLASVTRADGSVVITLTPEAKPQPTVRVGFSVECAQGKAHVLAEIEVLPMNVKLHDSY